MAERRAVTKVIATRYRRADKAGKAKILDELCATTGWHRDHARKALRGAGRPRVVRRRAPRPLKYGPNVVAALIFCWAVLGMPAGKRLAPILGELVDRLRRFDELDIDDDTAALLASMSAATIDRRLAHERTKHELKGRSHTKPGSLLKSQIPVRTWADWDDAVPGFVEIDLVAHDGGNAAGEHAYTLTVTDIATGWTENRSVPNKARKWVLAALKDIAMIMPFPILGVGFRGQVLEPARQRELFRRWTTDAEHLHPHEPVIGLLGLLHGASVSELRSLRVDDIDLTAATAALGRRPHPTPLDPASMTALQRCLLNHERPHNTGHWLLVNQKSKTTGKQVSLDYLAMILAPAQVTVQTLRASRLAQLVTTMDPVLVAASFGIRRGATLYYLADSVDATRLPTCEH